MSFSLQCAIVIDSTNKWIDIKRASVEYNYSITEGTYADLKSVVWEIGNTIGGTPATLSQDGITTIGPDTAFDLLFSTGTNAANSICSVIGFEANDYTGSTSYDSPYPGANCFIGTLPSNIAVDSMDRVALIKAKTFVGISQKVETMVVADDHYRREIEITHIKSVDFFEATGLANNGTYSQWWKLAASGVYFSYYKDGADEGTYALILEQNPDLLGASRLAPGAAFYSPPRLVLAPQAEIPRPT